MKRLVGVETEFGCLVAADLKSGPVPDLVRDHIFFESKRGLIDLHERDYDEPPGNGGFLYNGGRLYLDMGHIEYCTAECLHLSDLLASDLAGDKMLQLALNELGLGDQVDFVKNNIDHCTGATFGCHENYLMSREAPLTKVNVDSLLSFLALRGLMVGAGRVGAVTAPRRMERAAPVEDVPFQIMQRADYIQTEIYEWVQFNRAIINARDEPLADPARFRRLHLLLGDSNILPFTNALKIGSTALVLDLLEADLLPAISLADPVGAMRELSHQPEGPWITKLADGSRADALELLRCFVEAAQSAPTSIREEPDNRWTLSAWIEVLDGLTEDRSRLIGKIDWITKQHLLSQFVQAQNLAWNDPWVESLDLECHKLDPEKNLLLSMLEASGSELPLFNSTITGDSLTMPPQNTRAIVRSDLMRRHATDELYVIDWDFVQGGRHCHYALDDPFSTLLPDAIRQPTPTSS